MKRYKVILVVFNIVVIVAILVIAELFMRKYDLPRFDACVSTVDFAKPDPQLGFAPVPNSEVSGIKLNEMGLRGQLVPLENTEKHYRILYIGDSTCFGLGIEDLDQIFASKASFYINEDNPDIKVEYIIGAFPGYSSFQSRFLLDKLLPMTPDLVIFYVGAHNDHTRTSYYKDSSIPKRTSRLNKGWHKVHLLKATECVYDIFYRKFLRKLRTRDAKARVPLKEFKKNMTYMVEKVINARSKAIILIPPYTNHRLNRRPNIQKYREALEQIAKRFNIPYIDLQEKFKIEDENKLYFNDLFHFQEYGHLITAREIKRKVSEENMVK